MGDRSIVGGMDKFSMGMDMYRMNEMEQKHMNVDLMGRNNLMNTMGMRRNNMALIMGQQQPMMRTTNLYDLLRSQQQQQGLYGGHFLGRTNVYATNPVELMRMGAKPEMEVRRFQMFLNMRSEVKLAVDTPA